MSLNKEKTRVNLYGIKGKHNVHSWNGLAIHFKNISRVKKCERYATCTSNKRFPDCMFSIKRFDAVSMLESEFNVTTSIAEKLVTTLFDMGSAHSLRCYREASVGGFDEGTRMIVFDEEW
ncbi:MAG: hypothetical protein K0A90_01220 [Methanosarcinaceae archaeon]|nr:hypothetical protein [Methanosarcinaceae archaeon]